MFCYQIFDFVQDQYVVGLLNFSSILTQDSFKAHIEVIKSFLENVSLASVVNSLQTLFRKFNGTDLLLNNSNVAVSY